MSLSTTAYVEACWATFNERLLLNIKTRVMLSKITKSRLKTKTIKNKIVIRRNVFCVFFRWVRGKSLSFLPGLTQQAWLLALGHVWKWKKVVDVHLRGDGFKWLPWPNDMDTRRSLYRSAGIGWSRNQWQIQGQSTLCISLFQFHETTFWVYLSRYNKGDERMKKKGHSPSHPCVDNLVFLNVLV